MTKKLSVFSTLLISLTGLASVGQALADKQYDVGASDTEIVIGHFGPYSGPASAYGAIGKTETAYFEKINAEGGINGRKIKFISYDDAYSPPKSVEQTRKLIEQDKVLFIFQSLGTAQNSAVQKYMNSKATPQLFISTGATKFGDPKNFPWTMGWQPPYAAEARIYAQHILETKPDAKIAILMQNDDYGKDYLRGFEEGLGDKAQKMIIAKVTYESTDPTVDSQMIQLKSSGADVFFNITTPKFAAQAIKKAAEIGWKPTQYLNSISNSVGSVMNPAGAENGVGIITALYQKDPTDPQWFDTQGSKDWLEFMNKYNPQGDIKDINTVFGYNAAQTMVQVLKQCGDNLTRANVMKQAASLNDLQLPMLLPGVNIQTGPDDFFPIERESLARWDGKGWILFGKLYGH